MRNSRILTSVLAVALLAIGACSSQKGPATEAVTAAENALSSIRAEAGTYLSDRLAATEAQVAQLKDQLASKDYAAVIAGAPGVMSSISSLQEATVTRKADVETAIAAWGPLGTDVGNMISAIQSRVDTLSKSRSLPRGISREAFDSAKAGLDQMKATWDSANSANAAGDPVDAVTIARGVQAKGREVLALLGMPTG